MILILAPPGDVHARRVAQEIERQGHAARLLDWRGAGQGLRASLSYSGQSTELLVEPEGGLSAPVRMAEVRAVWNRRPGAPVDAVGVIDEDHRRFARQEWQDLLDGLTLTLAMDSCVINSLPAQRAAVKPYQLTMAQRVGLRVPSTLITSDARQAMHFVDTHHGRVVHKAMTSPRNAFVDTRKWKETDRSALDQLVLAPTIFQEFVEGAVDIRATVVGEQIYAAAIETSQSRAGIDSRLDLDVPATPYELPRGVAVKLQALMAALNLTFSTIDLKLDDAGHLRFLELNPQGQFLYIEILTGLPISAAVAQLLITSRRSVGT